MKNKIIIRVITIIIILLLIPIPMKLKDGGTLEFKAITYKISKVHSLKTVEEQENSGKMYSDGWKIEVLGFEIYNNVK